MEKHQLSHLCNILLATDLSPVSGERGPYKGMRTRREESWGSSWMLAPTKGQTAAGILKWQQEDCMLALTFFLIPKMMEHFQVTGR